MCDFTLFESKEDNDAIDGIIIVVRCWEQEVVFRNVERSVTGVASVPCEPFHSSREIGRDIAEASEKRAISERR